MFTCWCQQNRRLEFPADAETLTLYLTDMLRSGAKVSSTRRRYHAIAHYHRSKGIVDGFAKTEILNLLLGAQRLRCEKPRRRRPLTIPNLRSISEALLKDDSRIAIRDRAVMLLGFASALRSVNLAGLTLSEVDFCAQGLILTIPKEKQDQEGRGRLIGIPTGKSEITCAVKALQDWIAIRPGAPTQRLFVGFNGRHHYRPIEAEGIRKIVKRCVTRIGLDPRPYGAHSLRSGFITAAGEANMSDLLIAEQTGHRSMDTLRDYLRRTNVFRSNACAALDL